MNLRTFAALLRGELVAQLAAAGFAGVAAHSLIPGESFYAFVATHREPGGGRESGRRDEHASAGVGHQP
jgi:hypothetical protein